MIGVSKSRRGMRRQVRPWLLAALAVERQHKSGVLRQPESVLLALVDAACNARDGHERGGT